MCFDCVHKIEIPGNCYVSCGNPFANPKRKSWPGSGVFPFAYDPARIVTCNGYSDKPEDRINVKEDPFSVLVRILAGVGRL